MKLREWRRQKGMTLADVGALIGVSAVTVCRWEKDKALPKWPNMAALTEASGGAVQANDFYPTAEVDPNQQEAAA
jgi:transcriptional regulator with XRE-family HTH domain